jgi:hypothetical protein
MPAQSCNICCTAPVDCDSCMELQESVSPLDFLLDFLLDFVR